MVYNLTYCKKINSIDYLFIYFDVFVVVVSFISTSLRESSETTKNEMTRSVEA